MERAKALGWRYDKRLEDPRYGPTHAARHRRVRYEEWRAQNPHGAAPEKVIR